MEGGGEYTLRYDIYKAQGKRRIQVGSNILKQEDLLDLITALLKFKSSLSTTVAAQCRFQSSP